MLTGQNGILKRAVEAKEKTEVAQKEEEKTLQGYEDMMVQYTGNLPSREETKPYFPNSTFSYKEGDLSTGLVIKDSNNNEYVWVEVPTTIYDNTNYNNNGANKPENADDWKKIKNCFKQYTADYSNLDFKDTNTDGTTYSDDYKNMLKSVYTNGGFWIGRYEAGYEIDRNKGETIRDYGTDYYTEHQITQEVVIKKNAYPYNWVRRDQALDLAIKMNYSECTSSLIYGVQWDLILKYIESKEVTTKDNLTSNSIAFGNYYNANFLLNRGKFAQYNALLNWFDYNSEEKKDLVTGNKKQAQNSASNSILLTTGATEATNLQNIYDIAGNVYEWTLECNNTSHPCVRRGGSYGNSGLDAPANNRCGDITNGSGNNIGIRVGIWK